MKNIYQTMFAVMADIDAIQKKKSNSTDGVKYAFRGIEQFYNELHPIFSKHHLFITPTVLEEKTEYFDKVSRYNDQEKIVRWSHVRLRVQYFAYAEDGSSLPLGVICSEGLDNSDKATNKALSAAHKYLLMQVFIIPTEDIEDSDNTTPEISDKKAPSEGKDVTFRPPEQKSGPVNHAPQTKNGVSEAQVKRLWAIAYKKKMSNEHVFRLIAQHAGSGKEPKDLTSEEYNIVCGYLEALK